jgi:formamidopyrimidine-DNA glycosylase
MPELPEVETVRRALEREVAGSTITSVRGHSIDLRRPLDLPQLTQLLQGRRFAPPRRRGKFLLLDVAVEGSLLCHLGMSGRLMVCAPTEPRLPHTHLVLALDDGRELRYVDPRRFGMVHWLAAGEEVDDPSLRRLGIEPLEPGLVQTLPPLLRQRRAPLKSLILDQRLVAGVGNIYAAEALWRARIHPRRAGNRTSLARLEGLAGAVHDVLAEAVEEGGTTIRDYATPDGNFGYFAVKLDVYGRQGQPCNRCGTPLRAEVIGGRTTAWCSSCQR